MKMCCCQLFDYIYLLKAYLSRKLINIFVTVNTSLFMIPTDESGMGVSAVKNELGYVIYKYNYFLF